MYRCPAMLDHLPAHVEGLSDVAWQRRYLAGEEGDGPRRDHVPGDTHRLQPAQVTSVINSS